MKRIRQRAAGGGNYFGGKDKVHRHYPKATCVQIGKRKWAVFRSANDTIGPRNPLGSGTSPRMAWEQAAQTCFAQANHAAMMRGL